MDQTATPQVAARFHTLRGVQVLFDRDLALFFDVKPIRLREQVKRNTNRFPEDFMFQLTGDEVREMVSQNAIPLILRTISDFHDRFLILDGHTLYHIGASLKDLGRQCFPFSRMDSHAPEILARLPSRTEANISPHAGHVGVQRKFKGTNALSGSWGADGGEIERQIVDCDGSAARPAFGMIRGSACDFTGGGD
jgi:hypothetical protein